MTPIRTILHATDFSDTSAAAFRYATDLAKDYKARLVVVHVVEPVVPVAVDGIVVPNEVGAIRDAARGQLDNLQPVDPAVKFERMLREGPAVDSVVEVADEIGADLIVIGTHGRSGIGRLILGSVAEGVLRRAHCPVLTVRPKVSS